MQVVTVSSAKELVDLINKALKEDVDIIVGSLYSTVWFSKYNKHYNVSLVTFIGDKRHLFKKSIEKIVLSKREAIAIKSIAILDDEGIDIILDFPIRIKSRKSFSRRVVDISEYKEY